MSRIPKRRPGVVMPGRVLAPFAGAAAETLPRRERARDRGAAGGRATVRDHHLQIASAFPDPDNA